MGNKYFKSKEFTLNFNKSITSQATRFGATGGVVDKPGVFYFPIWRNDSIVSGQTLTAKIPTTLQLAAMYGANMDITSDVSKNTYICLPEMPALKQYTCLPAGNSKKYACDAPQQLIFVGAFWNAAPSEAARE